jgi:hypothetical protein
LGDCRETFVLPFIGPEILLATTAARTREVKTLTMPVDSGSSGLFLGVSASNSTGASQFPVLPTSSIVSTTFYHFCPHLTPKAFVVNTKLGG